MGSSLGESILVPKITCLTGFFGPGRLRNVSLAALDLKVISEGGSGWFWWWILGIWDSVFSPNSRVLTFYRNSPFRVNYVRCMFLVRIGIHGCH